MKNKEQEQEQEEIGRVEKYLKVEKKINWMHENDGKNKWNNGIMYRKEMMACEHYLLEIVWRILPDIMFIDFFLYI